MPRRHVPADSPVQSPILWAAPNPCLNELRALFADIGKAIPWTGSRPFYQSVLQMDSDRYKGSVTARFLDLLPFRLSTLSWIKTCHKSCYAIGREPQVHVHIPVIPNPEAFFVFPDHGVICLDPNGMYVVDTREEHSLLNGARGDYVYLSGEVASGFF